MEFRHGLIMECGLLKELLIVMLAVLLIENNISCFLGGQKSGRILIFKTPHFRPPSPRVMVILYESSVNWKSEKYCVFRDFHFFEYPSV
jgi:hypothetical protein